MSEWPIMSLREAGVSLLDCEHRTPPDAGTGYPYIAILQVKHGRLDLSDVRRISSKDFADWTRKALPRTHDVILSRRCNPGETAMVPAGLECALGQNLVLLRADPAKMCPSFLRWLVRGPGWWEQIGKFLNVGAVFDSLKCADIPNFKLTIPSIFTQRRIAAILGSLDDKIELNRRTNETLEAMARTLFRSWFVDFDPVRAKADGRKPHGMDAATATLFPNTFEPSAIGPIPKGWRVAPLGEFVEVAKGLSYKGDGLAPVGLPLHNLNSVYEGGGYKHEGIKHYTGEYRPAHVVRAGDLIVTNTEQGHDHLLIGYSAIVPKRYGNDGLFSHHIFRVRPSPESPLTTPFVHHLLLSSRFRAEVIGYSNGTTVNMLHIDGLKKPRLVLPPAELVARFTEFAESLIDKAEASRDESRTLAATRVLD